MAQTLPFQRFWKGAAPARHFYTSSSAEGSYAVSAGYELEHDEGRVFTRAIEGTTRLYRISRCNRNSDCEHLYSTDVDDINARVAHGWRLDSTSEFIWAIPKQVAPDRARVSLTKYCELGTCADAIVLSPATAEEFLSGSVHYCGGIAEVYVDGTRTQTIQHGDWRYGALPGSVNAQGCYAEIGAAPRGTHEVRLEYSGYSGYFSGSGAFHYVLPSFTGTFGFPF